MPALLLAQNIDDRVITAREFLAAVDGEDDDVGALEREHRLLVDVLLEVLVLRSTTHTAGIQQQVIHRFAFDAVRHVIARGPGDLAHDGFALTDHPIEERGLAGIGPADNGDDGEGGHVGAVYAYNSEPPSRMSMFLGEDVNLELMKFIHSSRLDKGVIVFSS